jgi:ubiquinol-cytochrome c reductase cytochrome b subunit
VEANPLVTPPHIVPEWYFLPYYAILRAIPDKLFGVMAFAGSISLLLFLPWLDTSKVKSTRYRPIYKWFFALFMIDVLVLGYLGAKAPEGIYLIMGRIGTAYYFMHLLVILPLLGWIEKPSAMPGSITDDVLGKKPVAAKGR